jgi:hypothetical protein
MSDLWSALYERVTLARQQFQSWFARVSETDRIEGIYPDAFWDEAPVKKRGQPNDPNKRQFRLIGQQDSSLLQVKHRAPDKKLYFDHVTPRQLEWMGRGRRDVSGKRVPIYGDMVLRTSPDSLIDAIVGDEVLWDELRRVVLPHLLTTGSKRAIEWRRYWIHAQLASPYTYWQRHPQELQNVIRVLGALAARLEFIEPLEKEVHQVSG